MSRTRTSLLEVRLKPDATLLCLKPDAAFGWPEPDATEPIALTAAPSAAVTTSADTISRIDLIRDC
jgi:hypothetical protein